MSFPAAPTQQGTINGFGTAVASSTLSATAAGSLIFVEITSQITTGNSVSVTDNIGNAYTMSPLVNPGASQRHVEHWYCLSATAGVTAVTVNNTASANVAGTVTEWAGGAASMVASSSLNNASSTNPPASTVTPAAVGNLVLGSLGYVAAVASTRQDTLTGSFTALTPITRGTTTMHAGAYLIATSTAATGPTWAMSPTVSTGEVTTVFAPAAVAGGSANVAAVAATATAVGIPPSVTATTILPSGGPATATASGGAATVTGSATVGASVTAVAGTATAVGRVATVTGGPTNTVSWLVEVDWANNGTWTDITTYVEQLSITRGRTRETDTISPGTLTMTLQNSDGRFTPGKTGGAYYPNVVVNRPVRVSVNTGARSYLATVQADSWVASWDGGRLGKCQFKGTDGFKGLNRRTSQSFYTETVLSDNTTQVAALYPLSEPADATAFGNVYPAGGFPPAQLVVSKFGAGTFTAGDGQGFLAGAPQATYCTFTPSGSGNSQHMSVVQFAGGPVTGGPTPPARGPWAWGCWFRVPTAPAATGLFCLLYARSAPTADPTAGYAGVASAVLSVNNAGQLLFTVTDANGTSVTVTSAGGYVDASPHYGTASLSADMRTVTLYVDGVQASAVASKALVSLPFSWFVAGGRLSPWGESASALNGNLASVELYSGTDTSTLGHGIRWLTGKNGFYINNATSDQFLAVAQNYGFNQFTAPLVSADPGVTTHMANFDMAGQSYLNALQQIADTEQGLMFISGSGALRFKNRAYRVNQASTFTLTTGTGDVQADFQAGVDDTLLFNDYAATRPGGAVIRVRDTTTSSVADNGVYTNAATDSSADLVLLTTDNEVADYANYKVATYSQPQPRTPQVTVDLLTAPALWATVQNVEIGTRFTLNGLPVEAPAAAMDFIVESLNWDFDIPGNRVSLSMDTSPADARMYMTLDDPKYGLLDSTALFY